MRSIFGSTARNFKRDANKAREWVRGDNQQHIVALLPVALTLPPFHLVPCEGEKVPLESL
jgi:hypothetical protein